MDSTSANLLTPGAFEEKASGPRISCTFIVLYELGLLYFHCFARINSAVSLGLLRRDRGHADLANLFGHVAKSGTRVEFPVHV